jgi:hypothetical protein
MLSPRLLSALRACWKAARPKGPYLFPGRNPKKLYTRAAMHKTMVTAARRAGITQPFSPHTLRHVQGNATCFDITVASAIYYGGVGEATPGRGSISADGKTLSLELYVAGQATGATCADGAVGSSGSR